MYLTPLVLIGNGIASTSSRRIHGRGTLPISLRNRCKQNSTSLLFISLRRSWLSFIAIFQPLPHWVYLTTYKPGDMKTAANQLLGRQLRELTNNHTDDKRQFIMTSIYSDMVSDDEQARARWDENLDNAFWLIESMARYYLDGLDAYNSYKHGVRFVPGTIDKWTNIGLERVADHGVAYLKLDNGQIIEISREIYPDESVYFLSVMYQMQETIRETRLYGWLHDLPPKDDSKIHSFLDIPREQIVAWAQKQESKQIR